MQGPASPSSPPTTDSIRHRIDYELRSWALKNIVFANWRNPKVIYGLSRGEIG
ncbi:MAG: hypothetical protein ACX930_09595 [Erythrobacter sp.]